MTRRILIACTLVCCLSGGLVHATEPTSTSFRLKQSTVNGGGAPANSAGYVLNASASQRATVGTSSSPGYVLQSGFWSFVGSGLVPVLLTVGRNGIVPGNVDLSWSGNNTPYEIFEATDCTNVFSYPFGTTSANNYDDITPPSGLVCYTVLATAPGPAPPPNP